MSFIGQASEQVLNLISSIHTEGRVVSWQAALSQLKGIEWLLGKGIGMRVFVDTGIIGVGTVLAGEPTYSTYLLGVGLLGLLVLLILQARFVLVSYRNMKFAPDSYSRTIMLAFAVYGLVTINTGFLHNNFLLSQVPVLFGVLLGLTEVFRRLGDGQGHQPGVEGGVSRSMRVVVS